jgi:2'-5' RNA ligase
MSEVGSFRAFFAVPLDPPVGRALEEAARGLLGEGAGRAGWRVVPAERIHLTLKFLGDVPWDLAPRLEEALREAAAAVAPTPLSFGGWHLLPGPRDPRVLAVGVSDPAGTLPSLAALLEGLTEALGFPREDRPYLSHATVARRKPGRGGRGGGVPPPSSLQGSGTLATQPVARVVLMRSELGPDGPAYAVVAEARPGGPAGAGDPRRSR